MIRFYLKCFLLLGVLFFVVIFGMQHANQGMKKMKGYDDPSLYGAFTVEEYGKGGVEASILGQKVTSHDIEEKKKTLEEMKAYNFLSHLGKKLSGTISGGIKKMLDMIEA
ncbi:DUF3679 domain-containing protein [Peribacillus saganii]|uniref:DUF3679 domain-containing protein n=1 Tax=Peribacillus saganii TaxID=2303992 RepID=A0A372LU17_9BACI|nr:YqxA family protein [Peribacillus saganii]RFU71668.1 DUF3679 domain-containing protein [Peribacillus saganii]